MLQPPTSPKIGVLKVVYLNDKNSYVFVQNIDKEMWLKDKARQETDKQKGLMKETFPIKQFELVLFMKQKRRNKARKKSKRTRKKQRSKERKQGRKKQRKYKYVERESEKGE